MVAQELLVLYVRVRILTEEDFLVNAMAESFTDENETPSKKRRSRSSRSRRSSGIVFAVWVLIFLVLLIVFIVYSPKVMSNLKHSDFFKNHVSQQNTQEPVENLNQKEQPQEPQKSEQPVDVKNPEPGAKQNGVELSLIDTQNVSKNDRQEDAVTLTNDAALRQKQKAEAEAKEAAKKKAEQEAKLAKEKAEAEAKAKEQKPAPVQMTNAKIYFLNITSSGSITRKEVSRSIKKSDSPLTDAINELLKGPTVSEEKSGCTTLVSKGTKLLSAKVSGGVATLNFSEEMENNNVIGVESLRGQVQQIVYTATVFSTVSSVQILINGTKKNYFQCDAEEQFYIGSPLSRNSF